MSMQINITNGLAALFGGYSTPAIKWEDRDKVPTLSDFNLFVANAKYYWTCFKPETIKTALNAFTLRNFTDTHYIPYDSPIVQRYAAKGYPIIERKTLISHPIKEYKGDYSRDVNKLCYEFVLPSNYSLYERDFFKLCLFTEYPFLRDYTLAIYRMDKEDTWFFLEIPKNELPEKSCGKSVYVPISALMTCDPERIIAVHTGYFNGYYKDKPEYLEASLALLKTPTALRFFEDVKAGPEHVRGTVPVCYELPIEWVEHDTYKLVVDVPKGASKDEIHAIAKAQFEELLAKSRGGDRNALPAWLSNHEETLRVSDK